MDLRSISGVDSQSSALPLRDVSYEPTSPYLNVSRGQFTFNVEGNEGPRFFSRKMDCPGGESGVTIGRGYDMGSRNRKEIIGQLTAAGVPPTEVLFFAGAAGLKGPDAKKFVDNNDPMAHVISLKSQKVLFESVVYPHYEQEAQRLATKADVTKKYGPTNWKKLDPAIKEMLVDLTYRGDYTPELRVQIQSSVAKNDLEGFAKVLADRDYWQPGAPRHVPRDRFERRVAFVQTAMANRIGGY